MKELYLFSDNNNIKECLLCVEDDIVSHILVRESHLDGKKYNMEKPFIECQLENGEDLKEALFKKGKIFSNLPEIKNHCSIRKIQNYSGEYYYRIYRPIFKGRNTNVNGFIPYEKHRTSSFVSTAFNKNDFIQSDIAEIYSGVNQLTILLDSLNEIFKTIHPSTNNLNVYGNNIRNILILSCTEVETQLKGILKNNIEKPKSKYSTADYVKLKPLLKLDEYIISFTKFPWLLPLSPFENWNVNFPSQSIEWYSNYNLVKHDREDKFHFATLESVLNSVSAIAILLIAQYGKELPYWNDQIGSYFQINKTPSWELDEHYFPPFNNEYWNQRYAII